MIFTTTHVFEGLAGLRTQTNMMIQGILTESGLGQDDLERRLPWKRPEIDKSLQHEPLPHREGPTAFSMSLSDLEGKSLARARYAIENAIVKFLIFSLDPERCNRLIARMLRVPEWRIRQIRIRAGIPSARSMRKARLAASESQSQTGSNERKAA